MKSNRQPVQDIPPSRSSSISALEWTVLVGILLLASAVRLLGIKRGLPYVYYTDEAIIVNHAVAFGTGDLNPRDFTYPSLYMYVLAVVYGAIYAIGRVMGSLRSVNDFVRLFFENATVFYLPGRLIAALTGVASVAGVYAFARRAYSSAVGLTAAAFLAVSYSHAKWSHYVKAHVPAGLLVLVALWIAYSIYKGRDSWRRYFLAGAIAGFAASTIYHAGFVLFSVVVSHGLRWRDLRRSGVRIPLFSPKLLGAATASFGAFVLGTPYALLDWRTFVGDLTSRGSMMLKGGFWETSVLYPFSALGSHMGHPLGEVVLLGFGYALVRGRPRDWIIASQPLFLGSFFLFFPVHEPQHMLIAYPALAILGASFVADLVGWFARRTRWRTIAIAMVALLVIALPAVDSFRYSYKISLRDTRTLAKEWLETHIPPGSRLFMDSGKYYLGAFGPPLPLSRWSLEQFIARANEVQGSLARLDGTRRVGYSGEAEYFRRQLATRNGRPGFDVIQILHDPGSNVATVLTLDEYIRMGARYAVVSSFGWRAYGTDSSAAARRPQKAARYRDIYESLAARAQLVKEFRPSQRVQGPTLRIYRLPTATSRATSRDSVRPTLRRTG